MGCRLKPVVVESPPHMSPEITLTIHRATTQIGGNCIELSTNTGSRIVLDVGRPLDAPSEAVGLLPRSLDVSRPVDGVLISHPHQDHYGLLNEVPKHWPVYSGPAAAKLMAITAQMTGAAPPADLRAWESGRTIQVGEFRITPLLTDHSAFDAYMLLIETGGRRVLYTGDFRSHGRKASLVQHLMAAPPPDIDVLLMEGTNLGSSKPVMTESDLEGDFLALFKRTQGRVYVAWSAQNIDRTVTIYRACKRAGRELVVDLYTAQVLRMLSEHGSIPQPGWPGLKVLITSRFSRMYRGKGDDAFVDEMAQHGISVRAFSRMPNAVCMIRPSLIDDLEMGGVRPSSDDSWSFSMWKGYLADSQGSRLHEWFEQARAPAQHIHTSGHASPDDLRAFSMSINPKALVPIHGLAWDEQQSGFPTIKRLKDGEPWAI